MTNYLLGVQLLTDALKIVCFKEDDEKLRLFRLDILDLPLETEDIVRILKEWQLSKLPKDADIRVSLSLPESAVFLKELDLPGVSRKQLQEVIQWELPSIAPITSSEAYWGWVKVNRDSEKNKILVVVVRQEIVDKWQTIFDRASWKLVLVEPYSISFSRLSSKYMAGKTSLLVTSEEKETNFVVLQNLIPVFSTAVSVSLVGMKKKKQKLDKEITTELAASAKKVVSYWENRENRKIGQVVITGEGMMFSGLAKAINNLCHIPAIFGKTEKNVNVELGGYSKPAVEKNLIGVGSAYGASNKELHGINLLPLKAKKALSREYLEAKIAQKLTLFSKITLVFLFVNLILLGGLKFYQSNLDREISQTKLFVNNHPAQKYVPEVQAANILISTINSLMDKQKDEGKRLNLIANLIPPDVHFNSLNITSSSTEEWKIAGKGDRTAILAFYEKLKSTSGAKQISMPYSNLQKEKEVDFKINLIW